MPIVVAMLLGIACLARPALAQEPITIAATPARTFAQLPEQWKAVLDSHGSQLVTSVNGLSVTVVEIWWSKAVPGMEKAPVVPQANYSRLKPSAVVGLLHFPVDSPEDFREDSRDQKLMPGFYTLRYAQLSDSSDDQPIPYQDFVLLSPLDADPKPDRTLPSEELIQLSRRASHSQSPAAISLIPPNPAYKHLPSVICDDSGQCMLQANIHVATADGKHAQEFPLAIVLITPTRTESGAS